LGAGIVIIIVCVGLVMACQRLLLPVKGHSLHGGESTGFMLNHDKKSKSENWQEPSIL
jgi:hypothetical protein